MFGKLVNKYTKNPVEIVKALKDALHVVVIASTQREREMRGRSHSVSAGALAKAKSELSRKLETVRGLVVGGVTKRDSIGRLVPDMSHEYLVGQLTSELFQTNVLLMLIKHLPLLEFECKKLVTVVFNNLLLREYSGRVPAIDMLNKRPDVMVALLKGYESRDSRVALNTGCMLRKCARFEELARTLMLKHHRDFFKFFQYVELPIFDIASDAFVTFSKFLTRHPTVAADFMRRHFDEFFNDGYRQLICSDNYVTQRQSVKLLGELLLERHNYTLMTRYIGVVENLQLVIALMTGPSRRLQYDAFHVFKVFVANPLKTPVILELLLTNQARLIAVLESFQMDCNDDEQFHEECVYVLRQLNELPPIPPKPAAPMAQVKPQLKPSTQTQAQAQTQTPRKKHSVKLVLPEGGSKASAGMRLKGKKHGPGEDIIALLKKNGLEENELGAEDLACALPMLRKM